MLTVQFYLREKLFLVEFHSYTNGTLLLFSCCNTDGCPTVAKQPGKLETAGERGFGLTTMVDCFLLVRHIQILLSCQKIDYKTLKFTKDSSSKSGNII